MIDFLLSRGCDVTLVLHNGGQPPSRVHKAVKVVDFGQTKVSKASAVLALAMRQFDVAIAYDPHAFHLARTRVRAEALIYYSLELYLQALPVDSYPASLSAFERAHINTIDGLIVQSAARRDVFVAEYDLAPSIPVFILPVCARPGARLEPRTLPPKGQRRLIYLGGLTSETGVPRFCEAMAKVEGWELVLHGHGFGTEFSRLKNRIDGYYAGYYRNTRLDQTYFETPEEAEQLCGGMDVGLAWYDRGLSPNFDTAALSSGKIAAYLKMGLPIIVSRGSSFVDVLSSAGCAVALDSPEDLPAGLAHIEKNYSVMSAAALKLFAETYDVSVYEPGMAAFIAGLKRQ